MIAANLKDIERYYGVHKDFKEALEFIRSLTKDSPDGRTTLREGDVWVTVSTSPEKNDDGGEKIFEAHEKFIDIQCVLDGEEHFGYSDISEINVKTPYNEQRDVALYTGKYSTLLLKNGDFAIVFPEDAHIPCMQNTSGLKKAVAKVRLK